MAVPNAALKQVPDSYKYGWHDAEQPLPVFKKGLSAEVVAEISRDQGRAGVDDASCGSRPTATSSRGRCRPGAAT